MANLSSIDYVKLIAWIAYYKSNIILNKTQMQKLLFMCYGQTLAMREEPLFVDDSPKAWPFGPVFPRSYKRYEECIPSDLTSDEKQAFANDRDILTMIAQTVMKYGKYSATRLSDWSHQKDGPWYSTVFTDAGTAWNRVIDKDLIKKYFDGNKWRANI